MRTKIFLATLFCLTACTPTQSSQELNNRARMSDRFGPAHSWSTPPSEMEDVERRKNQAAQDLEREEILRRRKQDLDRHY